MSHNPHRISVAIIAIFVLAMVATASAQTTDQVNLREVIQRNGELLSEAMTLVLQTNSAKARASLEAARKLHQYSMTLLEQGDNPLMTARVAGKAREAILQTISIAKREARREDQAISAMERAAARLEQARGAFEEFGDDHDVAARKLIQEANDQLLRARNHMREHMFEIAFQLAKTSHTLSTRAIGMLKRDSLTPDFVQREIEHTDGVLERIAGRAENGQEGGIVGFLDNARSLQQRAKSSLREGDLRPALEQTRRAREIGTRTLRATDSRNEPSQDETMRALQFTDNLLSKADDIVGESAPGLDEARRLQTKALAEHQASRNGRAMRLTLQSRDALRAAVRQSDRPVPPERVHEALAISDALISRLAEALEDSRDEDASQLFARAQQRQRSAREFLNTGDTRRAMAFTRIAASLAREGMHRIGNDDR